MTPNVPPQVVSSLVTRTLEAELTSYIEQCVNGIDVACEALDFWRLHGSKYPG